MLQRKLIYTGIVVLVALHSSLSSFAQVNVQTGSAVFSLPMFNWQDNKSRLNSVVALSYSSGSGLKVNDVASNVGQGWNLVAGGVITRMQVGEPDDQQAFPGVKSNNGVENDQDITKYPAGWLYAPISPANGCPNALTKYPIYGGQNVLYSQHNVLAEDRQLDYFSFQFNGKAGLFVVDTAGGGTGRSLGDNKMKITFQTDLTLISQGIRTTITSFTIQDADGLIYKFTQHGQATVLHEDYCDEHITAPMTQPSFSSGNVYHQAGFVNATLVNTQVINSWYLTEIDDPLTLRKIQFAYVSRSINNTAGADIIYNQTGNYTIISHKTSISTSQEISSIAYPDGHLVKFTYAPTARVDLNGDTALSTVDISYTPPGGTARTLSEYQLNTTYFIRNRYGNPTSLYQMRVARLCLRSVKKIGVDLKEDSPPYSFDYYTGSGNADDFVPPPFFYAKDIWGFYNGFNSVAYDNTPIALDVDVSMLNNNQLEGLCFLNQNVTGGPVLNPKQGYAKNGLLKQVVYPTGGTLSYQYTQNTGVLNGNTTNVGGVHVTSTSSTDGGYSNGCSNPVVTNYNYVLSDESSSSLWGLEMPANKVITDNSYASEDKKWHWTWSCAPLGCCYWKYAYPGILSQLQAVDLVGFQKFMQAIGPILGIVTVITDIMDVATICGGATGFLAIAAVAIDAIGALLTIGLSCGSGDNVRNTVYTVFYNTDLNGASPLPTQFKRVEIIEGSGTMGKTVQEFTSDDDYPIWVPSNPDFSEKQRFGSWEYGLPKLITQYDVNGNIIKQTKNAYFIWSTQFYWGTILFTKLGWVYTGPAVMNCKCLVSNTYSQNSTDWTNATLYNASGSYLTSSSGDMAVDLYGMYSGRAELDTTYERVFRTSDPTQYVETVTTYQYDGNNYQVDLISVTQSNGVNRYKAMTYPDGYVNSYSGTGNTQINALYNNNILNEPIDIQEYVGGQAFTDEKVTLYSTLATGNIVPDTILEQRFTVPTLAHVYSPDDNTYAANFKAIQTYTYNGAGDLTGIQDEGGRQVTNIYDYNDKYIVASVVNANPLVDLPAYTSFETAGVGGNMGGWILEGTPVYSTSAITGSQSLVLGSNTLTALLNQAEPYIMSMWATGAMFPNPGITLTKSGPTINGFTYYEYAVPAGILDIRLRGNVTVDELRLYPATARMKTTTYDPLIGKTSECDENNRVTYYEYDNLGRLKFVKDDYHNALKMYEYNNVSPAKQNGCPGTYTNNLITEDFTRSNCGVGYLGGNVSYTIPAGQYTSAISQQDADVQAEIYLLMHAQAYADANGSCQMIYYNIARSQRDSTQTCREGYVGGWVTYSVPAGRYWSIISQGNADSMALNEINANAQAYANSPADSLCVLSTAPDWNSQDGQPFYCVNVGGALPAHEFILATDINPNSPTYNQTQYMDLGPTTACPANLYYNIAESGTYTKTNCPSGYTGGNSITYTVQPGTYSSSVNLAAANQLAINDVNANGQNSVNANPNATCVVLYYNTQQSGTYSKQGCACVYTGSSYTTTVLAGTYSSTVNQATANQLALNYIAANGQNNANNNGTCTTTCNLPSQKIINCACQAGDLEIVSQSTTGTGTSQKCITQWGYYYSDGTMYLGNRVTTSGPCPQQ